MDTNARRNDLVVLKVNEVRNKLGDFVEDYVNDRTNLWRMHNDCINCMIKSAQELVNLKYVGKSR